MPSTRAKIPIDRQVATTSRTKRHVLDDNNNNHHNSKHISTVRTRSRRIKRPARFVESQSSTIDVCTIRLKLIDVYTFDLLKMDLYPYSDIVQFLTTQEMRTIIDVDIDYTPATAFGRELAQIATGSMVNVSTALSPSSSSAFDSIFATETYEILQEFLNEQMINDEKFAQMQCSLFEQPMPPLHRYTKRFNFVDLKEVKNVKNTKKNSLSSATSKYDRHRSHVQNKENTKLNPTVRLYYDSNYRMYR